MRDTVLETMIKKRRLSVRPVLGRKLALAYGAVFAFTFILTGLYLSHAFQDQTFSRVRDSVASEVRMITRFLKDESLDLSRRAGLQRMAVETGEAAGARLTLIASDGTVLGDSERTLEELEAMENHGNRPEIRKAFQGQLNSEVRYSRTTRKEMLYVAAPLYRGGAVEGVVRLALPLDEVNQVLGSVRRSFLAGTVTAVLLALVVSFLLGNSITRRVSGMTEAALRYARGDLSRKIEVEGDDELRMLADSMNRMASALKTRMAESEKEKANLAVILAAMAEGVVAVDRERQVVLANASAEEIFQVHPGTALGKSLLGLTKKPRIDAMMSEAMAGNARVVDEIELTHREPRILRAHAISTGNGKEGVSGILVLSDITTLRRLEKMRSEFIANVSHELRTPLTSLRGFIETLLGGALEDKEAGRRFLTIMDEDAKRLERLIDDLLELSRLEARQAPMQLQEIRVDEEIRHVLEGFGQRLHEKRMEVTNQADAQNPAPVTADRDRVRQILVNLLDNAIKFNKEEGQIRIWTVPEDAFLAVHIQDTGAGIPEDAIGRVFERFFRVDKARSRGGTGLGLAIVRHLVEAHGGTVVCRSTLGKGTVFTFTLPLSSSAKAP